MGNSKSKSKDKNKPQSPTAPAASSSSSSNSSSSSSAPSSSSSPQADEAEVRVGDGGANVNIEDTTAAGGEQAYSFWDRNKTVKPHRELPAGSKGAALHSTIKATMKATLGGGELKESVKLPPGEDVNEWIAVNTVHFFNAASMIYGTCSEFCTETTCPTMSAGKAEYLWKDDDKYKKPTRVPAPQYIDLLLSWVDAQISNPAIFPVAENAKFPRNFMSVAKNIYKRLFRLYAHVYCSHAEKIRSIGANAHLNTCFKHLVYFIFEFNLMDKADMAPLDKFIAKFMDKDNGKATD